MPLIVNNRILNVNAVKGDLDYAQALEYRGKLQELNERYPSGSLLLKRVGYPRISQGFDPNMPIEPEIPPPIYMKTTKVVNGDNWGYCRFPIIQPNGMAAVPRYSKNGNVDLSQDETTIVLSGEVYGVEFKKEPDWAFYLLYKSGIVGVDYTVFDPEGDRRKELKAKGDLIRLQSVIRDMAEEKLRLMSQAWSIPDAVGKERLFLEDELERKVLANEERKRKDGTLLQLRGISEFLAECKNDDVTRPRAILQYVWDKKWLSYSVATSRFYFNETEICYVPLNYQTEEERMNFVLNVLLKTEGAEKWRMILNAVVDRGYIMGLDKYGLRWLAPQVGVALNQNENDLRTALLSEFCPE